MLDTKRNPQVECFVLEESWFVRSRDGFAVRVQIREVPAIITSQPMFTWTFEGMDCMDCMVFGHTCQLHEQENATVAGYAAIQEHLHLYLAICAYLPRHVLPEKGHLRLRPSPYLLLHSQPQPMHPFITRDSCWHKTTYKLSVTDIEKTCLLSCNHVKPSREMARHLFDPIFVPYGIHLAGKWLFFRGERLLHDHKGVRHHDGGTMAWGVLDIHFSAILRTDICVSKTNSHPNIQPVGFMLISILPSLRYSSRPCPC